MKVLSIKSASTPFPFKDEPITHTHIDHSAYMKYTVVAVDIDISMGIIDLYQ